MSFFDIKLNLSLRQVSRDYDNLRQENAKLREQVLQDLLRISLRLEVKDNGLILG